LVESRAAAAHQFDDLTQQHEASRLGMWTFLLTEIMFFGGLFLGYTVYRFLYPEAFAEASRHLDIWLGSINTVVLISSSLSMALAVHSAQTNELQRLVRFLLLTILLGLVFLGIKGTEYLHKFQEHLVPGANFAYPGPHARQVQLFFAFYFGMTGLHAFHMIVGIALLGVLVWQARNGRFSSDYYAPVELIGLYWHFVDIVWIFLFPLLYLLGRH
jgi:cytochrome c oxidase subunit III